MLLRQVLSFVQPFQLAIRTVSVEAFILVPLNELRWMN
jgi:hypothetical protein